MTVSHVLEELINEQGKATNTGFIVHLAGDTAIYLRRVLGFNRYKKADLALGHADNYKRQYPHCPLMNLRPLLSLELPPAGSQVVTYAYPENEVLDFASKDQVPTIRGDYYDGVFQRFLKISENPSMPCPCYETTIEIRSGASGGPVFDNRGRIIGVNCRGWDFRGTEFENKNLSYVIPVREALSMNVSHLLLPDHSWELNQISQEKRGNAITFAELARYGHVVFDPPLR